MEKSQRFNMEPKKSVNIMSGRDGAPSAGKLRAGLRFKLHFEDANLTNSASLWSSHETE